MTYGVSPFSSPREPHVRPVAGFPGQSDTSRPQRRARDRGKRGADVAKENNLLLEISMDRAKRQSISSPATTGSRGEYSAPERALRPAELSTRAAVYSNSSLSFASSIMIYSSSDNVRHTHRLSLFEIISGIRSRTSLLYRIVDKTHHPSSAYSIIS